MKNKKIDNPLFLIATFSIICVLLVSVALVNLTSFADVRNTGEEIKAEKDIGGECYTFTIDSEDCGKELCFKAKSTRVKVFLDDEAIYEYDPVIYALFGRADGEYFHVVDIPDFEGEKQITIMTSPEDESLGSYVEGIKIEHGNDYISDLYRDNLLYFLVSVLTLTIAIILIIGGFAVYSSGRIGKEIISMGVFALNASSWTVAETMYLQLLTHNPAAVHYLNYASLIILPSSACLFIYNMTSYKRNVALRVGIYIPILTFVIDMVLTVSGVSDYHDLLYITHAQLGLAMLIISIHIIRTIKNHEMERRQTIIILMAFLAVIMGGLLDLIRYLALRHLFDTARFFRFGLFFFVIIMGIYEVRELFNFRKYEFDAETFRKLAYTDALTGLPNRMAYNELEERMKDSEIDRAVIAQFDVNSLKVVNDRFGHASGDKRIRQTADILRIAFGVDGICFRTGGDEFIVVIEGEGCEEKYEKAITLFEKEEEDYNLSEKPEIPLSVAYGMTVFENDGSSDPEKTLKEADLNMYHMKVAMKKNV